MLRVQRKYKIVKADSIKNLQELVNDLIQKEYKDTEEEDKPAQAWYEEEKMKETDEDRRTNDEERRRP